jgi:DNA-binding NarL/FixJ family response regulator
MPPKLNPEEHRRREEMILPLLRRGLTNAEIAAELSISRRVVDRTIRLMLGEYGVVSRTALAYRYAQEVTSPPTSENKAIQSETTLLTPGEQEVVELAAMGLSDRQIARQTGRSIGSVKSALSNAYPKLRAKNRTELPALLFPKSPENPK